MPTARRGQRARSGGQKTYPIVVAWVPQTGKTRTPRAKLWTRTGGPQDLKSAKGFASRYSFSRVYKFTTRPKSQTLIKRAKEHIKRAAEKAAVGVGGKRARTKNPVTKTSRTTRTRTTHTRTVRRTKRVSRKKRNPGGLDTHAATELYLYISSDSEIWGRRVEPAIKNLVNKMAAGTYSAAKAVKLLRYVVDAASKSYAREFASPGEWNQIFSVPTRNQTAKDLRDYIEAEARLGNYDHWLYKKYQGQGLRKKRNPSRLVRRNVEGFVDATGFHPIRKSWDYDPDRTDEDFRYKGDLRKKPGPKRGKPKRNPKSLPYKGFKLVEQATGWAIKEGRKVIKSGLQTLTAAKGWVTKNLAVDLAGVMGNPKAREGSGKSWPLNQIKKQIRLAQRLGDEYVFVHLDGKEAFFSSDVTPGEIRKLTLKKVREMAL